MKHKNPKERILMFFKTIRENDRIEKQKIIDKICLPDITSLYPVLAGVKTYLYRGAVFFVQACRRPM